MKGFLTLLLLFTNVLSYSQTNPNKFDLKEFTPFGSNELKFDQIKPDGEYLYWRCLSTDAYSKKGNEKMVAEFGDLKYAKRTKNTYSKQGFLVSCGPGLCYYYIVAIRNDKTVEIIIRDEALKSFIGEVDNVEEVKILVRLNRLYVNPNDLTTGSYRKMGDEYLLYLFDYLQSCLPGDGSDEQSVKASLTSKGEFNLIDRRFYNKR